MEELVVSANLGILSQEQIKLVEKEKSICQYDLQFAHHSAEGVKN